MRNIYEIIDVCKQKVHEILCINNLKGRLKIIQNNKNTTKKDKKEESVKNKISKIHETRGGIFFYSEEYGFNKNIPIYTLSSIFHFNKKFILDIMSDYVPIHDSTIGLIYRYSDFMKEKDKIKKKRKNSDIHFENFMNLNECCLCIGVTYSNFHEIIKNRNIEMHLIGNMKLFNEKEIYALREELIKQGHLKKYTYPE